MKNLKTILGVILLTLLFVSCADQVTVTAIAEVEPYIYGFWGGLWHGAILMFSWVGSLFSDDIALYAIANNGGWYDFGFIAGAMLGLSGIAEIVRLTLVVIGTIIQSIFE